MYLASHPVLLYFATVSSVTLCVFGFDKIKARARWWRISERTLLNFCLLGGTIGGGIVMLLFRHKVSKSSFLKNYFGIAILQIMLFLAWWFVGFDFKQPIVSTEKPSKAIITPSRSYRPVYE